MPQVNFLNVTRMGKLLLIAFVALHTPWQPPLQFRCDEMFPCLIITSAQLSQCNKDEKASRCVCCTLHPLATSPLVLTQQTVEQK